MRLLPCLLALVLLGASPPTADAQRSRREVSQADDQADDRADRKKERLKKRLRALRAIVLVEELELDEETAAKLMPVLARYDDEFAGLARDAQRLRAKIDGAADADLAGLIDDLVENQRARWDLDEQRFAEVRKLLTRRQAARILIVLPEIDRRILEGARKAIKGPKGRKKARRKARDRVDESD